MIRIAPRLPAVLLSAAAALAMVSMSSSATATTRPSQAPLAAQLSRRVESASTSEARYRALLAVMHALRIGVYTSAGRTIARGGERGPRDLYFYDFELRALASELAGGSTSTVADLATELTHAGVTVHAQPVTATALDSAIAAGTREAQGRPRSPLSLAPLLFRDLGLHHSGLDPLQRTILLADLAVAGGPLPSRGGTLGAQKAKCPDRRPEAGPSPRGVQDRQMARREGLRRRRDHRQVGVGALPRSHPRARDRLPRGHERRGHLHALRPRGRPSGRNRRPCPRPEARLHSGEST